MSEINLPWIDPHDVHAPFPSPNCALDQPPGLVAAGGDLNPTRVLRAYYEGLFPWYEEDQPILWWSPDPRGVLYPINFITHKSLLRTLKRHKWKITYDESFEDVIKGCAQPRKDARGTWITNEMIHAYKRLHELNHAHSIEVRDESEDLIGGVYGISIGTIFFGESMFSNEPDASKVALLYLSAYLDHWGYKIIDTQLPSEHLASLGGTEISRNEYLEKLSRFTKESCAADAWKPNEVIDIHEFIHKSHKK